MADTNEDRGRSRRLGVEDRGRSGTSQVLTSQTIGRLRGIMCDPHRTHGANKKCGFPGLASKLVVTVSWFRP
jgi:hypothetical protein